MPTARFRLLGRALLAAAFALLACLLLCSTALPAHAEEPSESSNASSLEGTANGGCYVIYLTDGETRDITKEGYNTRLVIDKSGTYYLKGQSLQCYLDIIGGENVTVVLQDGLALVPNGLANFNRQVSAINVEDFDGTVTIQTAKNSTAKVTGYSGECGIRKAGTKTKLVFTTEDPDNPGTLIAKGSYRTWVNAPGIGRLKGATGNIHFESGNIEATGGKGNAPGIGIGDVANYPNPHPYTGPSLEGESSSEGFSAETNGLSLGGGLCDGIYINGGNIKAQGGTLKGLGSYGGAGIGGGTSPVKNLVINGGHVEATGGRSAAGIGGGYYSGDVSITINGGTVIAQGKGSGAGIGGGENARGLVEVTINGGHVFATGGEGKKSATGKYSAPGIGGGCYDSLAGTNIKITGGRVQATGGSGAAESVGIGSSLCSKGATHVTIDGGYIIATPGKGNIMIGGAGHGYKAWGSCAVTINGGTVTHNKSDSDNIIIGSYSNNVSSIVTGGTVRANKIEKASNGHKATVVRSRVTLQDQGYGEKIESLTTIGLNNPHYGLKDVETLDNDGALYLWLPEGTAEKPAAITMAVMANEARGPMPFGGEVKTGTDGTLCRATPITLVGNGEGAADGAAVGMPDQKKLVGYEALTRTGYILEGYASDPEGGTLVAKADGALLPNTNYTDENGAWLGGNRQEVKLYAQWKAHTYTVSFNANPPAGCSSTPVNNLQDVTLSYDQTGTAPAVEEDKLVLDGYTLTSWNTKADGTGTEIAVGGSFKNLTSTAGGKVTLYAQWRAYSYHITLKGVKADGETASEPVEATYDQPQQLKSIAKLGYESPEPGKKFLGWKNVATVGGKFYPDEASVVNLCSTDKTGKPTGYTLEATWGEAGKVFVVAMNIDEDGNATPLTREEMNKHSLVATGGTQRYSTFVEDPKNPGIYSVKNVAAGEYTLYCDNKPTGLGQKTVTEDGLTVFTLYYGTIKTESGEGLTTEISLSPDESAWTNELTIAYDPTDEPGRRTKIHLRSTATGNYKFQSYAAIGVPPHFEADMYTPNQTITINGSATIKSYSALKAYTVVFDKNADDATGAMEREAFNFGEEKKLLTSKYQRLGYSFDGWNTAADGTGTAYANEAFAKDLTTEDGATVTLYAQWKPNTYYIDFVENGHGVTGTMERQTVKYGEPTPLTACGFSLEGHTFAGWATEPDGSGKTFDDQASVESETTENEGVITLYAQWEHDAFTIEFNANDGTGRTATQTVPAGTSCRLYGNPFDYTGHTFVNWSTSPNGTGTTYGDSAELDSSIVRAGEILQLYAQWKTHTYTVSFDVNAPAGCSTTPSGSMGSRTVTYGSPTNLTNGFSLPGYRFIGWNTRSDGAGAAYSESDSKDLTTEDGGKVTLYAQWKAYEYTVTLKGSTAEGPQSYSQTFTFDQPGVMKSIEALGFIGSSENALFLGWKNAATVGGGLYPDQAHVINLCGFTEGSNEPAGYTLTAQWIVGDAKAYVIVMDNHENGSVAPIAGLASQLSLSNGDATFAGFTEVANQPGVYAIERSELPAGTYDIKLEGYDTAGKSITIEESKTATVALNYCTVKTANEDHLTTEVSRDGIAWTSKLEKVLMGTPLELRTTADAESGYTFQNYTTTGIAPAFEDGKTDRAQQTVTVLGSTTITAHNAPITYNVKYIANAEGATGDMPVVAGIPYDFEFALDECAFEHPTRTFTGWNTAADGTGTAYEDGAKVKNLTTENCTEVVLYAQWSEEATPEPGPEPTPSPEPSPTPGGDSSSGDSGKGGASAAGTPVARSGDIALVAAGILAAIAVIAVVVLVVSKRRSAPPSRKR